ncbi:MAG TPA: TIGR03118 family protein [Cellvibrionaceae bacterium]
MKSRCFVKSAATLLAATSILLLSGCGSGGGSHGGEQVTSNNRYKQTNLVASNPAYKPLFLDASLVNAWGISIRPAGAGGHFWVTASDASYEYVGDVNGKPLFQDDVQLVKLPEATSVPVSEDPIGAANGTVFNGGTQFVIEQDHPKGTIKAAAKFLFVSDNGVLSAWTERKNQDGSFDRPSDAVAVVDYSADGSSFFGLAMSPAQDKLFVADFGANETPDGAAHAKIRIFDGTFKEEPLNGRFKNPFIAASGFQVGDLVPFNIQTLTYGTTTSVFVTYVNTSRDEQGKLVVAVEDAGRGRGKLVEYTGTGEFVAIWDDRGSLNAPWGMVVAPSNFGGLSNQLIVGNFSDGTMIGFDTKTKRATEYLRDEAGNVVKIAGLWGLLFGNGASLGDANALYFAAGPGDETEGLFGSLRASR